MLRSLVGSEMCIRDSVQAVLHAEGEVGSGVAQIVVRSSALVPDGLVTDLSLIHI